MEANGSLLAPEQSALAPAATKGTLPVRQLVAAGFGNLIEWFDWNAYAFLSVFFAVQFFPKEASPTVALLGTFGILAIGFLVRPLASLFLGKISDVVGRRFTMLLTVYGMGASSLLIALSPTYVQVGVLAPILLLLARVIQGICIGGEYGAMAAFAMEVAPEGKRGKMAGLIYAGAVVGQLVVVLLVLGATWLLPDADMRAWGWRIIFGIGALLSIAGIWIRRGMVETAKSNDGTKTSLFAAFKLFPRQAVQVIGLTIGFTVMVYVWSSYLPTYAYTYGGINPKYSLIATALSLVASLLGALIAGPLSDKYGRKKTMLFAGVVLAVGTIPSMALLTQSLLALIIIQCAAMMVIAMLQASSMPLYSEMFPRKVRASGIGFPYSLTVALAGGTAPLIGTQMASANIGHLFPWYVAGLMVISVIFYATMKETAFKPLPE
ncbi:hypothetical protein AL755_07555 [Arthrobacter sp. ERGS1:01]|uniref:MFS transporter n=1 Tax=Arthrobacter sp. ERGS1:01 TaxID=1704044 RepID=UPI0006B6400A|nr:MFS transporter [Arthrobacter sp. ERGS1:01]ALE05365.1 hypothetical protein AL755_07555 [Arthrobacter sp. ERGS1:01]